MSSSLRDATAEEFVKAVDPSLEFVDCFLRWFPYKSVYKVKREDRMYVLKAVCCEHDSYSRLLNFEREALKEVASIQGITHLIEDYGVVHGDYSAFLNSAFLKEYADGFSFRVERIPPLFRSNLKSQLKDTVRLLNEKGYFGLDIADRNLVVSHDLETITLVDAFRASHFPHSDKDLIEVDRLFS